ncbi:ArsR/SmtB family transcription factor [Deinococcus yavapaiensis]|uniref:Helix-turn-helix protein n=1 Tax=Deinococcus yavapaiensis KR-236 TaxID=694435 RepID=A0A318SDQ3_9DEIO|nr:helix-turn-helix transcriptional regulator [Deinococcus yavapaiensis]PYE55668.1 hypothetical protein DES52_10231 [Deinococcus yavapaiensis KR-236]
MTRESSPSVWQRLEDPDAARVLVDPDARAFFTPFVWRERRVGDVAEELGVTVNAVLYRVRQFLRLGLLEVTRIEPRAGRAIRYYRSTSRGYFVPFSSTTAETVPELYEETLEGARRAVMRALTRTWSSLADDPRWFGLYTYGDEKGLQSHVVLPVPPDDPKRSPETFIAWLLSDEAPAVWDNTVPIRLAREDAKAFQRDLAALKHKYDERRLSEGGEEYLLRLTFTPT